MFSRVFASIDSRHFGKRCEISGNSSLADAHVQGGGRRRLLQRQRRQLCESRAGVGNSIRIV
jgi:hypothetical protein